MAMAFTSSMSISSSSMKPSSVAPKMRRLGSYFTGVDLVTAFQSTAWSSSKDALRRRSDAAADCCFSSAAFFAPASPFSFFLGFLEGSASSSGVDGELSLALDATPPPPVTPTMAFTSSMSISSSSMKPSSVAPKMRRLGSYFTFFEFCTALQSSAWSSS